MFRLHSVNVSPGIEHRTFLQVELMEDGVEFHVESSLVSVRPEDDRRVVVVSFHHALYECRTCDGVVCPVPSGLLVDDIQSQRIADVEKLRVGWIV